MSSASTQTSINMSCWNQSNTIKTANGKKTVCNIYYSHPDKKKKQDRFTEKKPQTFPVMRDYTLLTNTATGRTSSPQSFPRMPQCLHSALCISLVLEPMCYKAKSAAILSTVSTHGSVWRPCICGLFKWTLLLYPHNWWSLHWCFCVEIKTTWGGIGPVLHKQRAEQKECGGSTPAWRRVGGWVLHQGTGSGTTSVF